MEGILNYKPKLGEPQGFANLYCGYYQIGLCTPTEVINYGQNKNL